MEKKKTPIAQKELKTTPKRVDALLFLIINLAITSLWWFVNHISRWSGEGLLNLIVVPLALGIIIAMFEIFFVSRLKFGNTLVKFQVFTGLIGQMIGDWLIYSSIHSIGPSIFRLEHPTYQNSTLWLANDVKIWYFMGVWFIFTFVFLLPGAITLLIRLKRPNTETKGNEEKKDIIRSWHLAMILLGILLGLRIGSSWSMPFFHLLYTALLFPFALSTIQSAELRPKSEATARAPLLPLLGFLYAFGFWSSAVEAHQSPHLTDNWIWFAVSLIHLIALVLHKRIKHQTQIFNPAITAGLWCTGEIAIIFLSLANLFGNFALYRSAWVVLGMIGSSIQMEMALTLFRNRKNSTEQISKRKNVLLYLVWSIFGTIAVFVGLLFPYLINIFDPLSSYIVMSFAIINAPLTIIPYLKRAKLAGENGKSGLKLDKK